MRSTSVTLAVLLGTAGTLGSARADNALRPEKIPTKARELATRGRVLHDAGDYAGAVAAFKEAYVLAPSPGLLFNIAQAYRLSGNCDDAAWMYHRYLDTDPQGTNRQLAEQHLATVEKCGSGGLRMTSIAPPKLDSKLSVPPPESSEAAVPPRLPLEQDQRPHSYKRAALATGIVGGISLAAAGYFALQAHDAAQTVNDTYGHGGKWEDIAADNARGQHAENMALVFGIGGGIAVASSAVLYAVGHHYEKAQRVAVTPTPHGAQVSMSWGF